ncbi:MAG: hypothetical protein PHQ41_01425 [Candidatus Cloacimonetes bacterium]|nr:hypothetical protein [Candidatus Cloacimonadota bacterium]
MSEIHSKANKIFLWGLIGLALAIWGNFAYKLLTNIDPSTETPVSKPKNQIHSSDNSASDSVFSIEFSGNFRDPFFRTTYAESDVSTYWDNEEYIDWERSDMDQYIPYQQESHIVYPQVLLLGIIGNTAVLKIYNETQYVKTGDQGLYGEVLELSSGYVKLKQMDKIITLSITDPNILNNAPAPKWQNE